MIYDMHVHMTGWTSEARARLLQPRARRNPVLRHFARRMGLLDAPGLTDAAATDELRTRLLAWVEASAVNRFVLLALDGAYRPDGSVDADGTVLTIDNDEVADLVSFHKKLLFGASIHPARPDALAELDRLIARGACLVKWIPSAQNIRPEDPGCFPFYDALAAQGLPLLVHTGNEHTLRRFSNTLNDPRRLIPALERGVTVIAAHCGTRLFLHERSYFKYWEAMAREYETFYGDLSAFALPLHGGPLAAILGSRELTAKVVYGSDFPAFSWPFYHLTRTGFRVARRLAHEANPLDKAYLMMKSLGVPPDVFGRAGQLLRPPMAGKPGEAETPDGEPEKCAP
jgi:predicted TIM-barrel fold metal-dependent hydrolase